MKMKAHYIILNAECLLVTKFLLEMVQPLVKGEISLYEKISHLFSYVPELAECLGKQTLLLLSPMTCKWDLRESRVTLSSG